MEAEEDKNEVSNEEFAKPNPNPSSSSPSSASEWWAHRAWQLLLSVKRHSPLTQCITNFVSMDLMANTLLSVGASPAMIHSIEEIPDFTPRVAALCVNVGTLSAPWLSAMKLAVSVANASSAPWVLDPVAAGATAFRLRACLELSRMGPAVIRGNGSEIIALAGASSAGPTKGADSCHESTEALESAKSLARSTGAVVAVSGAVDFVTDGYRVVAACNGVEMLKRITGTGCSVTALIAAFLAAEKPPRALEATAAALAVFGVASELGMRSAQGPGSLRTNLIDELHWLDKASVISMVKITSENDD